MHVQREDYCRLKLVCACVCVCVCVCNHKTNYNYQFPGPMAIGCHRTVHCNEPQNYGDGFRNLHVFLVLVVTGSSGCATFEDLPSGLHRVRAISRGPGGARFLAEWFDFSM